MDELVLPLTFMGEELEFPLKMYAYGYTFRLEVQIGETAVTFEPDEEGSYRALTDKSVNIALLQAIAVSLEKLR